MSLKRRNWWNGRAALPVLAALMLAAAQAPAPASAREAAIIERLMTFLIPPLEGSVEVLVVYDPLETGAREAAEQYRDSLMTVQSPTSREPWQVRISDVNSADVDDADLIVLTGTSGAGQQSLSDAAAEAGAVTLSTNKECVRAGYCVFAISSTPLVEIWFSREAAERARLRFAPPLLMLARKL